MTKQDLQPTRHYFIGIDPDVTKNGVAIVERETRHLECAALTFAQTLDYLQWVCSRASEVGAAVKVYIEAGWLNRRGHVRAKKERPKPEPKPRAEVEPMYREIPDHISVGPQVSDMQKKLQAELKAYRDTHKMPWYLK